MSKSAYELFRDREHPNQEELENFANRCNDTSNNEYWFRAGWLARQFVDAANYVTVRKEDLTLNWYKETKARLQKEEKNVENDS
jgi:hypothetical protein